MSARREKKRRAALRCDYEWEMRRWICREPPRWRFIRYRRWLKEKPVKP